MMPAVADRARRSAVLAIATLAVATLAVATIVLAGCGLVGPDPGAPEALPYNGTGEFRSLTAEETGVLGTPAGRALFLQAEAFDRGMVALGHYFYATADPLEPLPAPTEGLDRGDVDWALFGPRRIHRSAPRAPLGASPAGFEPGETVLIATEAWQGEEVYGPWALAASDGRVLLYYATAVGIGLAEASAIDGTFAPVGAGPVVGLVEGAVAQHPTVVERADGTFRLYAEAGGRIVTARSLDGVTFEVEGPIELGPDVLDDDMNEVAVEGPGAVAVVTPVGRSVVRLYFESVRANGTHSVLLAASEDGRVFERFVRAMVGETDRRGPSPVLVDERTTLLYLDAPRSVDMIQRRIPTVTIAPSRTTLE
jgi:hypothetical protein